MTPQQQKKAAKHFAESWQGKGYEKGETQRFWLDLLHNVFGEDDPTKTTQFEIPVKTITKEKGADFIDGYITPAKVLIEQKGAHVDLAAKAKQSDGSELTPYQQARRYAEGLPLSQKPRWIVTCNFREFWVYDMERPNGEPQKIALENLENEYYRLQFLVDLKNENIRREEEVSLKAGELVGKLYDALIKEYIEPDESSLRSLNILCVRIVFCLYAEDAGLFATRTSFEDYIRSFNLPDLRDGIIKLFKALDTQMEQRDKYDLKIKAFPYVNGGLFADQGIEIPNFTEEIVDVLVNHCCPFDWSEISPTIFGAVFESTLNPETRRKGGMHYTSVANIHKVIDPLFMDDLNAEFESLIGARMSPSAKRQSLLAFQRKLGSLTFLDPACGSGNFLTETYLSLRRLENKVISALNKGEKVLGFNEEFIKVSINQFYGIEINDFAVTVATTALWISEAQMLRETEKIIRRDIDFLPLKPYHNIREGNALRMDWDVIEVPENIPTIYAKNAYVVFEDAPMVANEPVIEMDEVNLIASHRSTQPKLSKRYRVSYDYIIGNPPFVGFTFMTDEQKEDVARLYPGIKNIDYVSCWFKKACDSTRLTDTECAFVATNSITQGETVSRMWERLDVTINFAWPTFRWDSEATEKAHVHCVIIGFSHKERQHKHLYSDSGVKECRNINAYLMDAPDIIVKSRTRPLCDVPPMIYGNKPADGGNLIFTKEEKTVFLRREPKARRWMHTLVGGTELINNKPNLNDKLRYTLWLVGITPAELRGLPAVMERVAAVKAAREHSPAAAIRKFAETPHLYAQRTQPNISRLDDDGKPVMNGTEQFNLLVPRVSSEKRKYVPMGYVAKDVVTSDSVQIIPDATLYHFGVLESNVHMAWMRAVCGRLKSDYRYSKDVVYNNFPWPTPTEAQRTKIEQTAQAILDARALYPDSSLADLYDEVTMPPELRRAHQQNDRAVMEAYGWKASSQFTESMCVAELFKLYQKLMHERL